MANIRKQRTSDGRCTVFVGQGLVVSDLDEAAADRFIDAVTRAKGGAPVSDRSISGRGGAQPASPARQTRKTRQG